KPLIVQPVLPRFSYVGDTFRVEARAFNGTDKNDKVEITAHFEGLELDRAEPGRKIESAAKSGSRLVQSGEAKTGDAVSFEFPVVVVGKKNALVRFDAKMGEHKDSIEVKLPIL